MARTQFHSAAPEVPRTQFHAHRGIIDADLDALQEELIRKIVDITPQVSSLLEDRFPQERLEKIDKLAAVDKNVQDILARISQQPPPSSNPSPADVDRSQP